MKKFPAALITVLMSFSLVGTANAAVKAGDKCSKVGKTSISAGKKFTCIKAGNRLVWNKGSVIAKPAVAPIQPIPSATPSPGAATLDSTFAMLR